MSQAVIEMMNSQSDQGPSAAAGLPAQQLAESTYRSLRGAGLSDTDIMAFAGELLSLVAAGVRAAPDTNT